MTDPEIIAYSERSADDPLTGVPGVIRKEWRLVPYYSCSRKDLLAHFGANIHSILNPRFILELRYIQRGVVKSWKPMGIYESEESAYSDLDTPNTTHLLSLYIEMRAQADREMEAERIRESEEFNKREMIRELKRKRALADSAFTRLHDKSPEDNLLCEAWNTFVSEAKGNREELSKDARFLTLYHAAYDSDHVSSKRKAIREFLAYVGRGVVEERGVNLSLFT